MENTLIDPPTSPKPSFKEKYLRFDILQRIEHVVMLLCFTTLAITGLPQKFPTLPVSYTIIVQIFGGIRNARLVHHSAAVVLMVIAIIHFLDLLYRALVLRVEWTMLPLVSDFTQLFQDLGYYLGFRKHKAYYGRYSYVEKAEYLALVWGTVIMAITGFMMWNPIATTKYLPGQFIPAAKYAHGGEAILAVLAIIVWHFYHVHLKSFNKSMWTGKLDRKEMEHEHPAELAEIETGQRWQRPPAELIRKRSRVYYPIATVLAVVMLGGVAAFVNLENTAPITVPPQVEQAQVFVPLTPTARPTPVPSPTPLPGQEVASDSWNGKYGALFRNRCGTCHVFTSVGGLNLSTYQNALKGGNHGPAIVPGNPDASILVQVQSKGDHPGQLTIDELNQVINWIKAGAPEQ